MLEKNKNYTKDIKFVIIEGEEYPLIKTSDKMAFYIKEDRVRRISLKKVEGVN